MATNEPVVAFNEPLTWIEPLAAYRHLKSAGFEPQLLEGLGLHPEARRAYIALAPAATLEVRGGTFAATTPSETTERTDVLAALREWTSAYTGSQTPGPNGTDPSLFTGGWVGFVGYEFLHHFEPTLPVRAASTPDLWLALCRDVLVFDRGDKTIRLLCHDLPGESDAKARGHATLEVLAQMPDADSSPSTATASPSEPHWETSLNQAEFEAAAKRIVDLVHDGDLFQANIATRFKTPSTNYPADLFERLATANPSPYMALIDGGPWQIVSCSPEQLFAVEQGVIRARPIAGTRPRGIDSASDEANEQDLVTDPKEQAEHTMLVDLLRNDLAKVCAPGTVQVPERMSVERYRHVMHLVSRVEGQLRQGTDFVDWLGALFPGGTITGAPKHRACLRIAESEPVARGPYTGSAGMIHWNGDAHWNILIRTLVLEAGQATVHAGSGIVAESNPTREWHEAGHKAQALLEAATGGDRGAGNRTRVGEVTGRSSWAPPAAPDPVEDARVLLIDNYDSFTYNLADYLGHLGANVTVIRNDEDWLGALATTQATHIVLSPGPGRPEESGATLDIATAAMRGELTLPILGVCLGHQALALAAGGSVRVGKAVHGKAATLDHHEGRLLGGLDAPVTVGRYHSLVVAPGTLPDDWKETAWLGDGTLMAMEHATRPIFGVQFHPESISTDTGLKILRAFLVQ